MALTADPGPRGLRIDAGVIEDARTHRNHRRRRYWASLVLVALIAAVAVLIAVALSHWPVLTPPVTRAAVSSP